MAIEVSVTRTIPRAADAVGIPVGTEGPVPRSLGLSRAALGAHGFEGKVGQVLVVPASGGPTHVAVGVGAPGQVTASSLRTAAAALARAVSKRTHLATSLAELPGVDPRAAAQAVVEGVLLAAYRYTELKRDKSSESSLRALTLVAAAPRVAATSAGATRGEVTASAARLARDLANTPPAHLTARQLADRAHEVAAASGLGIEVFDEEQLAAMGCGGVLGVNRGSTEPPRVVKLTYTPRNPTGHLALVGKGVMYDSGGISLKPSDGMHVNMKMDMSGAAAVLAAMSALRALRCRTKVTGYLMCTDNMPSGSALKLGDVLTFRNGTTAEIHNTDAEGRLILADGLALAVEEGPDAVIDIATLTGACVVALGPKIAGLLGSSPALVEQVKSAAERTDEPVWQLPLAKDYRKMLDSNVADLRNIGGPYGGTITAALFLSEFVGDTPWAHLDIAGPMNVDADEGWLSKGATGFGTRLLIEAAVGFSRP
jgi:leucyl aminopeptidase